MLQQTPMITTTPMTSNDSHWRKTFPRRIKALRLELNMSQQEVGDYIGTTTAMVCRLEGGHKGPSIDTLIKLADTFGTSIDHLLGVRN